jgi:hypothetical protein
MASRVVPGSSLEKEINFVLGEELHIKQARKGK